MSDVALSKEELDERVLILKRFRELLLEQRKKFQEYLTVLEKQEFSIIEGDTEKLMAHTELEQNILGNIYKLQKVITPMEEMYRETHSGDADIPELKADLAGLQERILVQNEKNRTTLKEHLTVVRTKIQNFQNPYRNTRSVYAQSANTASIVSVEG